MADAKLYSNSSSFASFHDADEDVQIVEMFERRDDLKSKKDERRTRLGSPSANVRSSPRRKAASSMEGLKEASTSSSRSTLKSTSSMNKSGFDLSSLLPAANRVEIPSKLRRQHANKDDVVDADSSLKSVADASETTHISIHSSSSDSSRLPSFDQDSSLQNKENQAQSVNESPNKKSASPQKSASPTKPTQDITRLVQSKSKWIESLYSAFKSSPNRNPPEEPMETVITPESRKKGLDGSSSSMSKIPRPNPQTPFNNNDQLFNAGSNLVQAMEAFVVQNNIEMNDERVKTIVAFDTLRSDFEKELTLVAKQVHQLIEEKYKSVVIGMKERYQVLHQELDSVKELMHQAEKHTVQHVETKSKLLLESLQDNEKLVSHSIDHLDSKLDHVEKKLTEEMMAREGKEECLSLSTHAMMERMTTVEKFINHQSTDLSRIQKELKKMELLSKEAAFQDVLKARRKRSLDEEEEDEPSKRPRTGLQHVLTSTQRVLLNAAAIGFTLYGLSH